MDAIEYFCISWFVIEIVIRLIVSPNKLKFIKTPYNIIDAVSIFPFFLWLILSSYDVSKTAKQIISILRIMLLFKTSRHSDSLKSFGQTLMSSYKELISLFVYLSIGVIFFSIIVFYCEKDTNPSFVSGPATFWWG